MAAESKKISLEPFVQYLGKNFPSFDETVSYPYDLEDGLLIWMNLCLKETKTQPFLKDKLDYEIIELEDLAHDLSNGWMLCLAVAGYFPQVKGMK